MAVPALKPRETQVIKISSKRQVTIPAKCYEELSFDEYALCSWDETGMSIEPIKVDDKDSTIRILRQLVAQGFEGEDLIDKYQEIRQKIVSIKAKINESEEDLKEGHVDSWENVRARIRDKYDV